MSDQEAAALFQAAHEEWLRGLSDSDFNQVVARTRPPDFTQYQDPGARQKAILNSIAAKQRLRPKINADGYPVQPKGPQPQ